MNHRFLIGVNYWPADSFVSMWKQFDAAKIEKDFTTAREYGISLIRFFLLWEDFQTAPNKIDEQRINDLYSVLSLADSLNLKVIPTLLVGHMSGPNWLPGWITTTSQRIDDRVYMYDGVQSSVRPESIYRNEALINAQEFYIESIVSRTKHHESIWAWDIANEIDRVESPSDESASLWLKRMVECIRASDPDRSVTCGCHIQEIQGDGFHLRDLMPCDILSLHLYPMYNNHPPTDVDYLAQRIKQVQSSNKSILLAEFGVPTSPSGQYYEQTLTWASKTWKQPLVTEESQAQYMEQTLTLAQSLGCVAALAWCWSDYHESLFNDTPLNTLIHERYFGLFRADGTPKPSARALQAFNS